MGKVLRIIEFYLFGRISLSTSYVTGFVQVFGPIFQLGWLSGTVYGRLFQFLVLKVLSPGNHLDMAYVEGTHGVGFLFSCKNIKTTINICKKKNRVF